MMKLNEQILNYASTAIVVLDARLCVLYANNAAETLFAHSHKQLLGCPVRQLFVQSTLDLSRIARMFSQGQNFSDSEVQFVFPKGRHGTAEVMATLLHHGGQDLVLLEMKGVDQQKRISQETQQHAQQQAARELVRGLAHEIKNPLGGLRGAAQLLDRALAGPEMREYTQMIIEQADRLRSLVDRLLGPNQPPEFRRCNIHQVLEKVRLLMEVDNVQGVMFVRDYDPSIPELWIDEDKIQQVILNIVKNAVEALANQQGACITLSSRIERQQTINSIRHPLCVLVKIADNGPGIPATIRDTLFYPMVTSKAHGTGLGLSIAQNLIEHHKGKIEVDSWPGHSEFNIFIPISEGTEHAK